MTQKKKRKEKNTFSFSALPKWVWSEVFESKVIHIITDIYAEMVDSSAFLHERNYKCYIPLTW